MCYKQYLLIMVMSLSYQYSYNFVFLGLPKTETTAQTPPPPPPPSPAEVTLKAENDQLQEEKQKSNKQLAALTTELASCKNSLAVKDSQINTHLASIAERNSKLGGQTKVLEASNLQVISLTSELAKQKAISITKDAEIKTQVAKVAEQATAFDAFKQSSQKNETLLKQEIEKSKKESVDKIALLHAAAEKLKKESEQEQQKANQYIAGLTIEIAAKNAEISSQTSAMSVFKDSLQKLQMKADAHEAQVGQLSIELQKMKEKENRLLSMLALFEHSTSNNLVQLIRQELRGNNA